MIIASNRRATEFSASCKSLFIRLGRHELYLEIDASPCASGEPLAWRDAGLKGNSGRIGFLRWVVSRVS
jgi:hypothetical protein